MSKQEWESDADAALSVGMDTECMRIVAILDRLVSTCNPETGYGRSQVRILARLRQAIYDEAIRQ